MLMFLHDPQFFVFNFTSNNSCVSLTVILLPYDRILKTVSVGNIDGKLSIKKLFIDRRGENVKWCIFNDQPKTMVIYYLLQIFNRHEKFSLRIHIFTFEYSIYIVIFIF